MDHAERTRQLETKPVGRLLFELSLPAVAAATINASHNLVNRYFVGQTLHEDGMAAVTLSFPIMTVMLAAGMMISIGSGSLISIRLGEKKNDEAERIVGQAIFLFILMSVGFMVFGLLFLDPMLRLFQTDPNVLPLAKQYISILVFGAFFHEMSFGVNGFLRAEGKARTAMITTLISALLNIFFDWLFLIHFRTGIWGAATATLLAQFFSTAWIMWHYTSGKTLLRWRLKYIRWDTDLAQKVFMLGLPPFIMQVFNFILQSLQIYQLSHYGKLYGVNHGLERGDVLAQSVIGVIFVVSMCVFFPLLGLNQGMQPIVGYNIGARRFDRVAKALKLTICCSLIFTVFCSAFILIFPEPFLRPFINNDSPLATESLVLGSHALRIFISSLAAAGIVVLAAGYFQSNGMPKKAIALTMMRQVVLLIPILIFLPRILESMPGFNGLDGIWLAVPISDIGGFFLALYFLIAEFRRLKAEAKKGIVGSGQSSVVSRQSTNDGQQSTAD